MQKELDDELERQKRAMLMEKEENEGPTTRITSDHIIRESEERKKKEDASEEK
jgi:hypothetical protein